MAHSTRLQRISVCQICIFILKQSFNMKKAFIQQTKICNSLYAEKFKRTLSTELNTS